MVLPSGTYLKSTFPITSYENHPSVPSFVLCHVTMNHEDRQARRQGASTFSTGHNGTMAPAPGVLLCRWGAGIGR